MNKDTFCLPEMIETKMVAVSPDMAAEYLGYGFEEQRPLDRKVVNKYASQMKQGEWGLSEADIVLGTVAATRSGQFHLLAGQHRLSAVIESDTTQVFKVTRYKFKTTADMVHYYFDTNRGKTITSYQALTGLRVNEEIGVSGRIIITAQASLRCIASGLKTPTDEVLRLTANFNTMAQLLHLWGPQIKAYSNAMNHAGTGKRQWFQRSQVMAVALLTYRYRPDMAEPFWREVAIGADLPLNSPQYRMRDLIADTSRSWANKKEFDNQLYRVTRPWNAYVEGRETIERTQARRTVEPGPRSQKNVFVRGTPFTQYATIDPLQIVGLKEK